MLLVYVSTCVGWSSPAPATDLLAGNWRPMLRSELESMLFLLFSTKWGWKQDRWYNANYELRSQTHSFLRKWQLNGYLLTGWRLALCAKMGPNFKCLYLRNGKSEPYICVMFCLRTWYIATNTVLLTILAKQGSQHYYDTFADIS